MSVDDAATHRWSEAERAAEAQVRTDADVVGGPARVAELLAEHIAASHADEVIVTTNTFSFEDRLASYERLAGIVELETPFPTAAVSAGVGSGGRAQHA